jgi:glycosyltransferase involved in cell wall biosynthesis
MQDFVVLVVGDGKERDNIASLLAQNELDRLVHIVGAVDQGQLATIYNASDIFVLPSLMEGHSVALLEAMRTGLPIVASDVGGNKESVTDGINGYLFETADSSDLANKIQSILRDPNLQSKMSQASRRIYSTKFGTNVQMDKHIRLYSSLINQRSETSRRLSQAKDAVVLIDNQGLSHYSAYLARGLARHRKVILCSGSKNEYRVTGAENNGVHFYQLPQRNQTTQSVITTIIHPLRLLLPLTRLLMRTQYTTVHVQGHLPMFFFCIPYLKLRGKRIVWTIHDINLRPSSRGMRGKLEIMFVRITTQPWLLASAADKIVVHGQSLRDLLVSKRIDTNKISVVPHFDYRYLLENRSTRQESSTRCEYVLLFGRIKPYKGIDVFIKSAKIVREKLGNDFAVLIAGKGDSSYFQQLLSYSESEYIRIRNEFIPNDELPEIIEKSRFLVLPYTDASQSGIIPLAYTFAKPVVVSDVGSISEAVQNGETGYIFRAGDAEELAKIMIRLLEDPAECDRLGRNAYEKMLREMSLERCSEIIDGIYKWN